MGSAHGNKQVDHILCSTRTIIECLVRPFEFFVGGFNILSDPVVDGFDLRPCHFLTFNYLQCFTSDFPMTTVDVGADSEVSPDVARRVSGNHEALGFFGGRNLIGGDFKSQYRVNFSARCHGRNRNDHLLDACVHRAVTHSANIGTQIFLHNFDDLFGPVSRYRNGDQQVPYRTVRSLDHSSHLPPLNDRITQLNSVR